MNTAGDDGSEIVGVRVDTAHLEPPCHSITSAVDAVACDPCLNRTALDTDLHKALCEHVSNNTATKLVVLQAPQLTHTHDAAVVHADPRAVVELMHRCRHA